MYHCGPTVYDYAHIGNMRSFLLGDLLRRMFELNGYNVTQVMNITDVGQLTDDGDEGEDKMTTALIREGKPKTIEAMRELATFYTDKFVADLQTLNIKIPNELPKATEHLTEEVDMIEKLLEKNIAYKTSDGIYFDTSKFENYGELGNLRAQTSMQHSRTGINPEKRNYRDFALWKFNDMGFESSLGKGFPGWHIECSAMAMKYLGETFDIHTGGIDLSTTHHNNEIAQSESVTGKQFVRYWLHHEFINVGEEKMAKSKGNFFQLHDISAKGIPPLAYKVWLLSGHYRTPMNFTWDALMGSQIALGKLIRQFRDLGKETGKVSVPYQEKFMSFINDDLQTPQALALVWELLGDGEVSDPDKRASLLYFDKFLGLGLENLPEIEIPEEILNLAEQREAARKAGNFAEADLIRKQIEKQGFIVEDAPSGPKIYRH